MKVALVYVYAGDAYLDFAMRFLASYNHNSTPVPHTAVVVSNAGPVTSELTCLFSALQNCTFLEHNNAGYDIGAFQFASRTLPDYDLMLFFGASSVIRGPRWLQRVIESYERRGLAQFGTMGNRGVAAANVEPHIRTTGFWLPPSLFNRYPFNVSKPEHRYEFEHGKNCLTSWLTKQGLLSWVVTWDWEYPWEMWDRVPNGFHQGNQSNLIFSDRLCDPPYYP